MSTRRGLTLRTRLASAMVAVAVVVLACSVLVARRQTRNEVLAVFEAGSTYDEDLGLIEERRAEQGSWDGIEPLLRRIGEPNGERLLVTDDDGRVLADTHDGQPVPDLDVLVPDELVDGERTARLYTLVWDASESYTFDEDVDDLLDAREEEGSWEAVGPLLAEIGDDYGERLILTDPSGRVLADSDAAEARPDLSRFDGQDLVHDDDVAVLYTVYAPRGYAMTGAEALRSLDRWYAGVGLVGAVLAVAAAVGLARRLARPLAELRAGVEAIAGGDLDVTVDESGPPEIAAVARAVNGLAGGLDAAIRQRNAMTADVAHELRGPVANLQAYVEGMIDGVAQPSGADLAVVHGEILRLHRLVEDLQQLSLADAGQLTLHRQPVALGELAERAVGAASARANDAAVGLRLDVAPVAALVDVDADRMRQAIDNLIDNAIRHGPPGTTVDVSVAAGGSVTRLEVADAGPGIPPDELDRVFERLHRLDPARTRTDGGAGLGLSIARTLVELHGGRLTATNRSPTGAVLSIELPVVGSASTGRGAGDAAVAPAGRSIG